MNLSELKFIVDVGGGKAIEILHNLCLRSYARLGRDSLTVQEVTTIFESARDTIINNKKPACEKEGETF